MRECVIIHNNNTIDLLIIGPLGIANMMATAWLRLWSLHVGPISPSEVVQDEEMQAFTEPAMPRWQRRVVQRVVQ